jgi:hypothetical protein
VIAATSTTQLTAATSPAAVNRMPDRVQLIHVVDDYSRLTTFEIHRDEPA